MPLISDGVLTQLRALAGQARPDSATVLRKSQVSDDSGGFIGTYAEVATGLSARISAQGMQPWEKIDRIEGRVVTTSVFLIALPAGTDVRSSDRVRVDTLGMTYEVIATHGPSSYEVERTVQTVLLQ